MVLRPAVMTITAAIGLVAGQSSELTAPVRRHLSQDPHRMLSQYDYSYHTSQLLFATLISVPTNAADMTDIMS